jgi:hypothetical protein
MTRRCAVIVAVVVGAAACKPSHQRGAGRPDSLGSSRSVDVAATLPRLWVFYGGETEPFCISLHDDGTGGFYGGFVQKNPLHWQYDTLTRRLDVTLSNLTPDDYIVLKDGLMRGRFFAFDSLRGTVSYVLDSAQPRLNVFGWMLEPAVTLEEWQRPYAAKGCPLLTDAGGA